MKRMVKRLLVGTKRWLTEEPIQPEKPIPFDNSYEWIGQAFRQILADPVGGRYRSYAWGVLQGASLAKVLGLRRMSVFEFEWRVDRAWSVSNGSPSSWSGKRQSVSTSTVSTRARVSPNQKTTGMCPICGKREIFRWTKPLCGAD